MPGLAAVSSAPAPSATPATPAVAGQAAAPADLFGALLRGLANGQPPAHGQDDRDADRQGGALLALANGQAPAATPSQSAPAAPQNDAAGSGSAPRGSAGASIPATPATAPDSSAAHDTAADTDAPPAANPSAPASADTAPATGDTHAAPSQPVRPPLPHGVLVASQGGPPPPSDPPVSGASLPPLSPPLLPVLTGRAIFVRRADAPSAIFAVDLATLGARPEHHTAAVSAPALPPPTGVPVKAATSTPPTQATPSQPAAQPVPVVTAGAGTSTSSSNNAGSDQGSQSALGTRGAAPASATFGVALGSGLDTSGLAASLALTIRSGVTEARLQLRPAGLGAVHVQIISNRDGVTLRLAAESTAVGDLLRAHAGDLRDALAAHGVTVADLHILPNQPAPRGAESGGPAWQQDGGRRADRDPQDGSGGDAPPQEDDGDGQAQ